MALSSPPRSSDGEDYFRGRDPFIERQRWMFTQVFRMMPFIILLYCFVFFAPAIRGILEEYESILASEAEGMQRLPDLRKQISTLEAQLASLTTKSIETRLSTIETAVRVGSVKPDDIATVQELKEELDVLKTYMFRDPRELVELKELQKNYQEIRENQDRLITKDEAYREIKFTNNLFYASIGLFALLLAVMGGSWISTRRMKRVGMSQRSPENSKTEENE